MAEDEVREFCRRMRPRLVGVLSLMCGEAEVAEELAQEALVRAWSNWKRFGGLGEPEATAWTYRTAINLANSWGRRRIAERRAMGRLASRTAASHTDPDTADAVAVRRAVAALPQRQRTALVLRYFADLPVAEVADLMGCSSGTVKSLTNLALTGLRRELRPRQAVGEVIDGP